VIDVDVHQRFWDKVTKTDTCWNWTAAKHKGYGQFTLRWWRRDDGKWRCQTVRAHRFAYEQLVGPIPEGLTVEHECKNRACVRPAEGHCTLLTAGENSLAGEGPTAVNARKEECHAGHPFDEANTHVRKSGKRECRACARDRARRYRSTK
jgi:hypothetical protein